MRGPGAGVKEGPGAPGQGWRTPRNCWGVAVQSVSKDRMISGPTRVTALFLKRWEWGGRDQAWGWGTFHTAQSPPAGSSPGPNGHQKTTAALPRVGPTHWPGF